MIILKWSAKVMEIFKPTKRKTFFAIKIIGV